MFYNTRHWELAKNGEFVVGDRPLNRNGVVYQPGDDYPNDGSSSVYALYDTDMIIEKIVEKKKRKKKE